MLLILCLGVSGCERPEMSAHAKMEQEIQHRKDILAKVDKVLAGIKEIKGRMSGMPPGGDLEIESARLRSEQENLRLLYEKLDATY